MVRATTKMADLIRKDYHILPIVNRFDIFPGFGDKTIAQICSELNINVSFFLEIVNVFLDENYFPETALRQFTLREIIDYLRKSHDYFKSVRLLSLEQKIDKLTEICCQNNKINIEAINSFYKKYKNELIEHIEYEDKVIFPYVLWLEENKNTSLPKNVNNDLRIDQYMAVHTDIEGKINDLQNLFIKYLPISQNFELVNEIIAELFDFQRDIDDHQRFEERVMVPVAKKIEQKIF